MLTFKDSHHTVFTFRSWLYLLGVVLAFWIFFLKISKLHQNSWRGVIDITSFEKHLESSLDHTPTFCQIWWYFVPRICVKRNLSSRVYGDLDFKLARVKDTANFISSGWTIVKRFWRRQYDPLIIERTLCLVLGPSTAFYRPFLKHFTLTNKVVGTIWRALSKPPQRRQGPDPRPFWLLVGTPSAMRPELAARWTEHGLHIRMSLYIFLIYTETKKFSNSKPCWYLIYNKNSNTINGLKTDCSSLSTCYLSDHSHAWQIIYAALL